MWQLAPTSTLSVKPCTVDFTPSLRLRSPLVESLATSWTCAQLRTSKDLQTKKCDVCTLAGVQGGAVSDLGTAAKAVCLC